MGPHPPTPLPNMESHIGNVTGHAKDARSDFRRYCVGCHGELGDGKARTRVWLDPKPRDFTIATFKCRSTPTGTLPTDEDLFNTIGRGLTNSNMPHLEYLYRAATRGSGGLHQDLFAALAKREGGRPDKDSARA